MEIDRNQRSEELLKLGGGQEIFIFRGACPMSGREVRKYSFSWGEGACPTKGGNFLGGGSYLSAYYVTCSFAYFLEYFLLFFDDNMYEERE